jgi:hypothetical protein
VTGGRKFRDLFSQFVKPEIRDLHRCVTNPEFRDLLFQNTNPEIWRKHKDLFWKNLPITTRGSRTGCWDYGSVGGSAGWLLG